MQPRLVHTPRGNVRTLPASAARLRHPMPAAWQVSARRAPLAGSASCAMALDLEFARSRSHGKTTSSGRNAASASSPECARWAGEHMLPSRRASSDHRFACKPESKQLRPRHGAPWRET